MSNNITEFELISHHLDHFKFAIKNLFTYQLFVVFKVYISPEGHHHYVGLSEQLCARME